MYIPVPLFSRRSGAGAASESRMRIDNSKHIQMCDLH